MSQSQNNKKMTTSDNERNTDHIYKLGKKEHRKKTKNKTKKTHFAS